MTRIVAQHAGLWMVAAAMFAVLGVASAMPQDHDTMATTKERVMAPRAASTMVQDPTGQYIGYRRALAYGAL